VAFDGCEQGVADGLGGVRSPRVAPGGHQDVDAPAGPAPGPAGRVPLGAAGPEPQPSGAGVAPRSEGPVAAVLPAVQVAGGELEGGGGGVEDEQHRLAPGPRRPSGPAGEGEFVLQPRSPKPDAGHRRLVGSGQ
jgi:hypothetical protein